jgi:uncharacterized protein DUF5919
VTSGKGTSATGTTILLKVLLKHRHLHVYSAFTREYNKVAAKLDRELVGTGPGKAQFYRWISGEVATLPYAHHCRVLESMFPDWGVEQLFQPYSGSLDFVPKPGAATPTPPPAATPEPARPASTKDVVAVYTSRSEFVHELPPHQLFDDAEHIRVAGLSLNLLCQNYPDRALRTLLESGTVVEALFLDPAGEYIKQRDQEEGHDPGLLSTLTDVNIQALRRTREKLSPEARDNLRIRVYDETIRFNITIIDERTCIVQPYLPDARGVESPTIVTEKQDDSGLYDTFVQVFASLWDRAKDIPA